MLGFGAHRSQKEFEALTVKYLDPLYAAALRLTRNEGDAEDLVQDTFVRAFRFFDTFERGTNAKAWLFKILTNTFINGYRRTQKERSTVEGAERDVVNERLLSRDAAALASDPEQYFLNRTLSGDVVKAIDRLPIDFRMVVILSDLQEFSYKEIADILNCPVGTVMSRLFRGRKLLQKELRQHAVEAGVVPPDAGGDDVESAPTDLAAYRTRKVVG